MKKPARPNLPLEPEDWDFREVSEPYLHFATFYEYAREVEWIRNAFQDECEEASESTEWPFAQIFAISDSFPMPWLKLRPPAVEVLTRTCLLPRSYPAFRVLEESALSPEAWAETSSPIGLVDAYLVEINWGCGDEAILDAVRSELKRKRKELGSALPKPPIGKAASQPWSYLKELAAYRLRKAGFSYGKAQKFVEEHRLKRPVDSKTDVLPVYASGGAWSDATKAAEGRLRQNFARY